LALLRATYIKTNVENFVLFNLHSTHVPLFSSFMDGTILVFATFNTEQAQKHAVSRVQLVSLFVFIFYFFNFKVYLKKYV